MKHLNIQPSEISHVIISFEINKFVAYVQTPDGSNIAFQSNYKYADLMKNDELGKYNWDWKKPIHVTRKARQMARDEQIETAHDAMTKGN
jgi:Tol biopolymer transport system component